MTFLRRELAMNIWQSIGLYLFIGWCVSLLMFALTEVRYSIDTIRSSRQLITDFHNADTLLFLILCIIFWPIAVITMFAFYTCKLFIFLYSRNSKINLGLILFGIPVYLIAKLFRVEVRDISE